MNYREVDPNRVRCSFYVRTPSEKHPGMFDYTPISLNNPRGDGDLHTYHPPAVGDTISLHDISGNARGKHRVIARDWMHASYGSTYWPLLDAVPTHGPALYVLVEPAEDFFRDQAPTDEDEEER